MKCPSCNLELGENAKFCPICGTKVVPVQPAPEPAPAPAKPVFEQPAPVKTAPQPVYQAPVKPQPAQKLMGPWAYVGWQLLFSIPLVGFILLIVFSFDDKNLNLRNFARSYWCALLIGLILAIVIVVLLVVAGVSFAALTEGLPMDMPL